jgi:hypothetical protein
VTVAAGGAPLGVPELERLRRSSLGESGEGRGSPEAFRLTKAVLDTLGLGLEPTHRYLFTQRPTAAEFERWIAQQWDGVVDPERVACANAIADGDESSPARRAQMDALERADPVLSAADLAFWAENGYVVVADAAPPDVCATLEHAIWEHLGASPQDPDSWYGVALQQGVMVQLFHAPGMAEIHASPRIRKAFAQIAGTPDLVMTADRCGFNPPLRPGDAYGGPRLHLDLDDYATPVSPGLQGILYLTDTSENQGAFRCVPGFHRRIDAWLQGLPEGRDPTLEDLEAFGPRPIAARAGALIIWSAALPHGPAPNTATRPRIVHYLTMYPTPRPVTSGPTVGPAGGSRTADAPPA